LLFMVFSAECFGLLLSPTEFFVLYKYIIL
jgi:hypothetical protein